MTTRLATSKQSTVASKDGEANVKLAKTAGVGKGQCNEASVLSAMQESLRKATEEMGQVGKLLVALQADMTGIKEANVGLRTDVDGILHRLDEAETRISQLRQTAASPNGR